MRWKVMQSEKLTSRRRCNNFPQGKWERWEWDEKCLVRLGWNCCCFKDKISCLNYITVGSAAVVGEPHDAENVENIFNLVCCRQARQLETTWRKCFWHAKGAVSSRFTILRSNRWKVDWNNACLNPPSISSRVSPPLCINSTGSMWDEAIDMN